ncbi:YbgA family protein [Endozoicomonas sp. ALC020]|uniref:YbgA family protein n=1 Tax=unclassified Endozoicomonas TaxID=2644528 RepID=UPI003BAE6A21
MAIVSIPEPEKDIKLGISACLMGQKVRYDGGHKRSSFCMNTLSQYFHFEPVCPEVAIGLGTPREPIRLVGDIQKVRVVGTDHPDVDVTDQLTDYGYKKAKELTDISGYILMQKSPSCGMERVKVYHENGCPSGVSSAGAYAKALMAARPLLPVEEEGRLHDPVLRENFFTRVYAYHRWNNEVLNNPSHAAVVHFHSAHKYMIMAHNPSDYTALGKLVAKGGKLELESLLAQYFEEFMNTLKKRANRKSHTNTMLHILGYVKKTVDTKERNQFLKLVEEYRQGILPLVVPMTMLRHFIENHGNDYIREQTYLNPHPDQLGLRNQI